MQTGQQLQYLAGDCTSIQAFALQSQSPNCNDSSSISIGGSHTRGGCVGIGVAKKKTWVGNLSLAGSLVVAPLPLLHFKTLQARAIKIQRLGLQQLEELAQFKVAQLEVIQDARCDVVGE